jgi:hypothetical protein
LIFRKEELTDEEESEVDDEAKFHSDNSGAVTQKSSNPNILDAGENELRSDDAIVSNSTEPADVFINYGK